MALVLSSLLPWKTEKRPSPAFQIAEVHASRGEADAAFAWLARALAQRDGGLLGMGSSPALRPLHGDARWAALLVRVGLHP